MDILSGQLDFFTVRVEKSTDAHSDGTTYRDTPCVLALPKKKRVEGRIPVILFAHGFRGFVTADRWREIEKTEADIVDFFLDNGYAVFDVDNTEGALDGRTDLGCPQLMESYLKAWDVIRCKYPVQDTFFIYAQSFGTFTAMNLMVHHRSMVKAACLTGCRFSIRAVFERGPYFSNQIAAGFGFRDRSGTEWEGERVRAYDYYDLITVRNGKEVLPLILPPVFALISTGDTREFDIALRALRAMENSGNTFHLHVADGLNHAQICDCAEPGLRKDVLCWLEKYC